MEKFSKLPETAKEKFGKFRNEKKKNNFYQYLIGKHNEKEKLKEVIIHMQLYATEIGKDGRNFHRECKSRNFA